MHRTRRHALLTAALAAVLLLALATAAAADPMQQFRVQLKNVKADGSYSVLYTSNAFDSTGAAPPPLADAWMRLPKGMAIKPAFLKSDRLCELAKFTGYLFQSRLKGSTYPQRVDSFPQKRGSGERKLSKGAREIVDICAKAWLGRGTVTVDARPLYPDPIPAKFSIFLSRPTAKGALASIGILTHYDRTSPIAIDQLRYTVLQPTFALNIFNDPTPDGLYGYRVSLLTQRSAGLRVSIADLAFETKGLRSPGVKGSKGFWATLPNCPASREVPFKAEYQYVGGVRNSVVAKAPCQRFAR